jgi:hypothetical protein
MQPLDWRFYHYLTALLFPLVCGGGLGGYLLQKPEWVADTEILAQEEHLKESQPDIVIVGNSMAFTDVDLEQLEKETGLKGAHIKENGSSAPTWYTLLKYRVFENGHRPKVVVVVAWLAPMLETKLTAPKSLAVLNRHFAEPDAVLATRTLADAGLVGSLRSRAEAVKAGWMEALRDGVVGLIFGEAPEEALGKVFAQGEFLKDASEVRVIPVQEQVRETTASAEVNPADSYLGEITALCRQYGADVVFLRAPLAPSNRSEETATPAQLRDTIRTLNSLGAGWVDLWDEDVPETEFADIRHLNRTGKKHLTSRLAESLKVLGVGTGTIAPSKVPIQPDRVERVGEPDPIEAVLSEKLFAPCGRELKAPSVAAVAEAEVAEAGFGPVSPVGVWLDGKVLMRRSKVLELTECSGKSTHIKGSLRFSLPGLDIKGTPTAGYLTELPVRVDEFPPVWWVLPGTTLRFLFDSGWEGSEPFSVALAVHQFGEGEVLAKVAGEAIELVAEGEDLVGKKLGGVAPVEPWSVELTVPSGGLPVAVRKLELAGQPWIGGEQAMMARLIENPPSYALKPPELPQPEGITVGKDGLYRLLAPELNLLANPHLVDKLDVSACSPVRILEDGVALPLPNQPLNEVREQGAGRYQHLTGFLPFKPVDNSDPRENGRSYRLVLDENRKCKSRWWLYPGDAAVFTARAVVLSKIRLPFSALVLRAVPVEKSEEKLMIRVWANGRMYLERELTFLELGEVLSLPLQEAIPRLPKDLRVELESSGFMLVTSMSLSE